MRKALREDVRELVYWLAVMSGRVHIGRGPAALWRHGDLDHVRYLAARIGVLGANQ